MIEVLSQMSTHPPMVRSWRESAGITADVEGGPKVVEDSQLALKTHLAIFLSGVHCDINIFLIREHPLPFRAKGHPRATASHDGAPSTPK